MHKFTGVRVFSATKSADRDQLGEKITTWLRDNPGIEIVEKTVAQSSDSEFHCLSVTFFFDGAPSAVTAASIASRGDGTVAPRRLNFTGATR